MLSRKQQCRRRIQWKLTWQEYLTSTSSTLLQAARARTSWGVTVKEPTHFYGLFLKEYYQIFKVQTQERSFPRSGRGWGRIHIVKHTQSALCDKGPSSRLRDTAELYCVSRRCSPTNPLCISCLTCGGKMLQLDRNEGAGEKYAT